MTLPIEPLQVNSLKSACVARLEELILSGELKAGERLPAERDLAARLGVSRPVLHEALVDLAAKGLVIIQPRRGVEVNDFRRSGSAAILSTLLTYHNGALDRDLADSLFAMRILVETENARLAAAHITAAQLEELREIIRRERSAGADSLAELVELDFEFHLQISIASGNLAYPLILNSFKSVYTHFTRAFYQKAAGSAVIAQVYDYQSTLIDALSVRDAERAVEVMKNMLAHGERFLKD